MLQRQKEYNGLSPHPDSVYFNQKEFAAIVLHVGMGREVSLQARHKLRNNFGMVMNLKRNNPFV